MQSKMQKDSIQKHKETLITVYFLAGIFLELSIQFKHCFLVGDQSFRLQLAL